MNWWYYTKEFTYNALPTAFFKKKYKRIKAYEGRCDPSDLNERLNYYFKINQDFELPASAVAVKDFRRTRGTAYYLDLKEFLHYFHPKTRFAYHFGDETHINPHPTLFKARPIEGRNENSILFKLNKRRHFKWVKDPFSFEEKQNKLVWRGNVYQPHRKAFVTSFYAHPYFDVGQTNNPPENVPWQKPYASIKSQLRNKFIMCLEGNDVATNLKWALSSNSLCFMPKPRFETWFMEGKLVANKHYVQVANDFSDLEEKIRFYIHHPQEASSIIAKAHSHVNQFKDPLMEDLLCIKVLEKYAHYSRQNRALRFEP